MDVLRVYYWPYQDLVHVIVGLLVFGGLARIAFWRDYDGLRVGGLLAAGLALLLTIALVLWAEENGRRIQELGPWAAFLVLEAVLLLALNAFRNAKKM